MTWAADEAAKVHSRKFGISEWVAINQMVSISWEAWLNMPEITRKGIAQEVEGIAQARDKVRKDEENKLQLQMAKDAAAVKFPNAVGSSVNQLMR